MVKLLCFLKLECKVIHKVEIDVQVEYIGNFALKVWTHEVFYDYILSLSCELNFVVFEHGRLEFAVEQGEVGIGQSCDEDRVNLVEVGFGSRFILLTQVLERHHRLNVHPVQIRYCEKIVY